MKCPECQTPRSRVKDTQHKMDVDGWSMIVRKHRCENGHTYSTYECYEYADVEVLFKVREAIAALVEISTAARP